MGRAVDAAQRALAAIAAYDAIQPQAWIARMPAQEVLAQARAVDAAGDLPLAGLTFAVKDNLDVADLPTTAACPAFSYAPQRSATVVERLMAAGAVVLGKTNLDQFATGLVGVRSPYGAPRNVFNLDYISGGSSSGSAVAVAAGLVDFALGSDTAGSGRVPAAFNNLVGFKPSRGRWSSRGLVPACRSLDCVTVFTRGAEMAARIDAVVAGFDAEDSFSRRPAEVAIAGKRLGVPREDQLNWLGDVQAERLFGQAKARLAALGYERVDIDISPLLETAKLLYQGPWVAERTAAIEGLLESDPDAIHPVVREIIEGGKAITAVDAFNGYYRLKSLRREAEALWAQMDVLLLPTTATTYRVREVEAAPIALNGLLGLYTNFVNLLDMSAIAVPAGFRDNATGFGVTLIGPVNTDAALLNIAQAYEEIAPMPDAPALDDGSRRETVKLAVVGAHLEGMPLHWQLTSRGAALVAKTRTAPVYQLYAMAGSVPPKPALIHAEGKGAAIEVEVYELGVAEFGSFVVEVPPPLAIGTVTLEDGTTVKGFVAEPRAIARAEDITHLGGWRAFVGR